MLYLKKNEIKDSEYPDLIIATLESANNIEMDVYFHNEICDMNYKYVFKAVIKTIDLITEEKGFTIFIKFVNDNPCLYVGIALKYLKNNLLKKSKDTNFYLVDRSKINNFKYRSLIPNIYLIEKYKMSELSSMQVNLKLSNTEEKLGNDFFKIDLSNSRFIFEYYLRFKKGKRFLPLENKLKKEIKFYTSNLIDSKHANDAINIINKLSLIDQYSIISNWQEGKKIIKETLEYTFNVLKNEKSYIIEQMLSKPEILKYDKKLSILIIRTIINKKLEEENGDWELLNEKVPIVKILKGYTNSRSSNLEKAIGMFKDDLNKYY